MEYQQLRQRPDQARGRRRSPNRGRTCAGLWLAKGGRCCGSTPQASGRQRPYAHIVRVQEASETSFGKDAAASLAGKNVWNRQIQQGETEAAAHISWTRHGQRQAREAARARK